MQHRHDTVKICMACSRAGVRIPLAPRKPEGSQAWRGPKRGPSEKPIMSGALLAEDRVHCGCSRADHGLELMPVDLLGNDRGPVPHKVGDLLDRYSIVTHDRHERVPELSRCPVGAESGGLGDASEAPADVGRIERGADACAEDEIVVSPRLAGFEPLLCLRGVVPLEPPLE